MENEHDFIEMLRAKGMNVSVTITKEIATRTNDTSKIISIIDILPNIDLFKCIIVLGKKEASLLRISTLKNIPIIIWAKDECNASNKYDIYMKNIDRLFDIYEKLADENSRKALLGFITFKVTRNINLAVFTESSQYICEGFMQRQMQLSLMEGLAMEVPRQNLQIWGTMSLPLNWIQKTIN